MDRKSIIVVIACIGLLFLWSAVIVPKLYPPVPRKPGETNTVTEPPATTTGAPSNPASPAAPAVPMLSASTKPPVFATNVAEQTITITNDNARYTFTSHGGGLKLVQLVHYPETVSRQTKKLPLTNGVATLNTRAPAPVLALLGDDSL